MVFKLILVTDGYDISSEIAFRLTSLDPSDDKSTLNQVMAWCRQATSHYLNQCWPRSLPPYGVIRPQCVNWAQVIWIYIQPTCPVYLISHSSWPVIDLGVNALSTESSLGQSNIEGNYFGSGPLRTTAIMSHYILSWHEFFGRSRVAVVIMVIIWLMK